MRAAVLPADAAFRAAVADLWASGAVRSMAAFPQHGDVDCLRHCLAVAYLSWCCCRRLGLNARAAARGGLLHDLFLYAWHTWRPGPGERLHGFSHPAAALANARRVTDLTAVETDIILRHMWPLTRKRPDSPEGRVVTAVDKYVSLLETLGRPVPLRETAWLRRLLAVPGLRP